MQIDGTTIGSYEPILQTLGQWETEDATFIQDGPAIVANRRVRTAPIFLFDQISEAQLAVLQALVNSAQTWFTVKWKDLDWDDVSSWHGRVHFKCRFIGGLDTEPLAGHTDVYRVTVSMQEALESTT